MATKTTNSNYAEGTYICESGDALKITLSHVKTSHENLQIMMYMTDLITCLEDMLIDPPVSVKNVTHVVSDKTYYGV